MSILLPYTEIKESDFGTYSNPNHLQQISVGNQVVAVNSERYVLIKDSDLIHQIVTQNSDVEFSNITFNTNGPKSSTEYWFDIDYDDSDMIFGIKVINSYNRAASVKIRYFYSNKDWGSRSIRKHFYSKNLTGMGILHLGRATQEIQAVLCSDEFSDFIEMINGSKELRIETDSDGMIIPMHEDIPIVDNSIGDQIYFSLRNLAYNHRHGEDLRLYDLITAIGYLATSETKKEKLSEMVEKAYHIYTEQ